MKNKLTERRMKIMERMFRLRLKKSGFFENEISDFQILYVDPPKRYSPKEIELNSNGLVSFQTQFMTMDEIHKIMGLPLEAFGKQKPLSGR